MNAGIAALIGAGIGAVASVLTVLITKVYENKRHERDIIYRTALESWRYRTDLVMRIAKEQNQRAKLYPLDSDVVFWSKMSKVLTDKDLTPQKLRETFNEINELMDLWEERTKERTGQ